MLNNLYRKLHILFASSVMLIITLVISFVVANTVHTEKINESTLFIAVLIWIISRYR